MRGTFYNTYTKRILDVVLSIMLLIIFSPICVVTAIAIKLTSPGPIYADIPGRVGQYGNLFDFYKFRSMVANAHNLLRTDEKFKKLYEQYKKDSYKLHDDPRVTPVGRFIRKYSIDEIPQFLNVLKGEMSIVGPRAYYEDELDHQQKVYPETRSLVKKVLSVKPGITGLWQVSGRSKINFDERIAIDAEYVDNMSLWFDLRMMLKTPWAMISGEGTV